ncbi:hypothetical protein ACQPYE_26160 [Actinosynnema sp. CA-299493]
MNERHLRAVPDRCADHYNHRRAHQALQLTPPRPDPPVAEPGRTSIRRRPVLGGLINEHEPSAAQPRSSARTADFWHPTGPKSEAQDGNPRGVAVVEGSHRPRRW